MANAAEVDRIDDVDQGRQAQVAAHHTQQFAVLLDRHGDGYYQTADCGQVGRGQHGFVRRDRLLVPGALTRVVALGHFRVRALGEHSVYLTDVGELEVGGEGGLVDQAREVGVGALVRDVLRQVLQDQDPSTEPVLHAAGRQGPRLLDGGVEVLLDGVAL